MHGDGLVEVAYFDSNFRAGFALNKKKMSPTKWQRHLIKDILISMFPNGPADYHDPFSEIFF
jgi:hypothetical protein